MKLVRLRLSNFRSFAPTPTEIALDEMIFLLGPNGAGKTSVLVALARMFSLDPAQRKVRKGDFHVPKDEAADAAPDSRALWIEAEFEFPDLEDDGDGDPAIPGNFAHMQLVEAEGPLRIPHVTLLDLDLARHQGGWGRIKYAAKQLRAYSAAARGEITVSDINAIPAWDSTQGLMIDDLGWLDRLEGYGVFFSSPLDLDFMMMSAFEDAYEVGEGEKEDPDEAGLKAVLGKSHDPVLGEQYSDDELQLFGPYHSRFKLASKPVSHIRAMARLEDLDIDLGLPSCLDRMLDLVTSKLDGLAE